MDVFSSDDYETVAQTLEAARAEVHSLFDEMKTHIGIGEGGLDPEYEYDKWLYAHRTDVSNVISSLRGMEKTAEAVAAYIKEIDNTLARAFEAEMNG